VEPLLLRLADGREVEVVRKLVIGRDPRCGCPVDDPSVSGLHAVIEHGPQGWFVQDMNSLNGTWVGSQRVQGTHPLRQGDVLRLGGTLITVKRGLEKAPEAPPEILGGVAAPADVADTVMNQQRAEDVLGVPVGSKPEQILSRYEMLAGELRQKVHNAPTPALRRVYQRQLNELARAKDALLRGG
jgi:pSer/pThr/pTyr-binding forkhead associated (FHA) protein